MTRQAIAQLRNSMPRLPWFADALKEVSVFYKSTRNTYKGGALYLMAYLRCNQLRIVLRHGPGFTVLNFNFKSNLRCF